MTYFQGVRIIAVYQRWSCVADAAGVRGFHESRNRTTQITNVNEFLNNNLSATNTGYIFRHTQALNRVEVILCGLFLPLSQARVKKKCERQILHRATILITALHEFKKATGQYPSTLDELVPTMLPAIPLDPYDGEPMRYMPSEGMVYSVGEDLVDSGGSRKPLPHKPSYKKEQPATEDIVFDIENNNERKTSSAMTEPDTQGGRGPQPKEPPPARSQVTSRK